MVHLKTLAGLILLCIPFWTIAQVVIPQQVEDRIDRLFAEIPKDGPGYMIGVLKDRQVLFQKGYGLANLEHQVPISAQTAFNVASLSKQFTAACVALLILDKKLSLEDPVKRHIPELPESYTAIKVKHLVYMCSGLQEYYECERTNGADWSSLNFFSIDTAITATFQYGKLNHQPGSRWSYSNINFMLLARIVENISGKRLAKFAKERIFDPLGMHNTLINDNIFQPIPHRADGYLEPGKSNDVSYFYEKGYIPTSAEKWLQVHRNSPHYGGSGVYTSFADLAKWDANWYTHQLAGPEFYALMHKRMIFDHYKTNDAFGLVFGDFNGEEIVWYDGRTLGFRAYMMRFPEHQLTVICLSNLETGPAPRTRTDRLLDILLDHELLKF